MHLHTREALRIVLWHRQSLDRDKAPRASVTHVCEAGTWGGTDMAWLGGQIQWPRELNMVAVDTRQRRMTRMGIRRRGRKAIAKRRRDKRLNGREHPVMVVILWIDGRRRVKRRVGRGRARHLPAKRSRSKRCSIEPYATPGSADILSHCSVINASIVQPCHGTSVSLCRQTHVTTHTHTHTHTLSKPGCMSG